MSASLSVFTSAQGQQDTFAAYQRVLEQWTVPYAEQMIPTTFGETHLIVSGPEDAPPIMFMHALFATATVWYPNVSMLSQHYRTYAVDTIGEANKSRPARTITQMSEMVQWFTELLDGLGIQDTYLVGNSFGAYLSTSFAMNIPERIRRLVLIGPAATFAPIVPFFIHMFLPKLLYIFFPRVPGTARLVRHSLNWMRSGLPVIPAWEELFYLTMLHGGMTSQIFPKVYSKKALSRITTPTLLLIGDREKIYSAKRTIRIAEQAVPGLRGAIIPNAHHISALSNPEIVNQYIEQFFNEENDFVPRSEQEPSRLTV